jgi:hypothetical protein
MATTKKFTKRESFTEIKEILEGLGNEKLAEVMEHELELLAKKNSADRKPTATQVENEELKKEVKKGKEIFLETIDKWNKSIDRLTKR